MDIFPKRTMARNKKTSHPIYATYLIFLFYFAPQQPSTCCGAAWQTACFTPLKINGWNPKKWRWMVSDDFPFSIGS